MDARTRLAVVPLGVALACGCTSAQDEQVAQPVAVGMSDKLAPFFKDGQSTLYEVETPVRFAFIAPQPADLKALPKTVDGLPHAPWVDASGVKTTVRFTLSNLDAVPHAVELLVDPWNEYLRYQPGIRTDQENSSPDLSGYDRFFVLPPKGRIVGALSPDDTLELAIDLMTATIIYFSKPLPNAPISQGSLINRAFNLDNRSSAPDPVLAPYLPKGPVPAITGGMFGLRTSEPANVALEVEVDLSNAGGGRLAPDGTAQKDLLGIPGFPLTPPPDPP